MKAQTSASAIVPQCWEWHYHTLQTLLDRLLDNRSGHRGETGVAAGPQVADLAECAADEFDHALALGLLSQEEDALHEVVSAIHRIIDRTYGICEDTGMAIPAERLRAVPWARRTREAQEKAEREACTPGVEARGRRMEPVESGAKVPAAAKKAARV